MKRVILVLLGAVALGGCGGSGMEVEWPGPPHPGANGKVSVASFNDYLDGYPDYATSPEALATEFVRLDEREATTTTLVSQANGFVTVELIGLADDSVASERYALVVEKQDKGWRLKSAVRTQRCRAGRGHQDFSAALCL